MDKRDRRLPASIRGYDSDELFRKDLWLRRIADSRRKLATMREDEANGARTASVKRSNATLLLTVDEATEELRGLLNKLDAETQKEIIERACGFGPIT